MPSKSAKHRKALREIAISNLKKDRNFFVVGLTYGCLKRCMLDLLTPLDLLYSRMADITHEDVIFSPLSVQKA